MPPAGYRSPHTGQSTPSPIEYLLSHIFATDKRFIGPMVSPFSIAATTRGVNFIEIPLYGWKSVWAIKVENDIGIQNKPGLSQYNLLVLRKSLQRRRSAMTG
jgi:hypothetical protein